MVSGLKRKTEEYLPKMNRFENQDVKDYIQLFIRYRGLFLKIVAVFFALGLGIILLGPKAYKTEIFLKVGKIAQVVDGQQMLQPIEEPASLVERLDVMYKIKNVTTLAPAPIIYMKLRAFSKQDLEKIIDRLQNELIVDHNQKYQTYLQYYATYRRQLEEKVQYVREEIKILEQRSGDSPNPILRFTMSGKSILLERRDYLLNLTTELEKFKLLTSENVNVFPTHILNKTIKYKLDWKWPLLILAMTFCSSILFFFVLVLYIDRKQ